MSGRARKDHAEEGPMLIQAKISAPDTLLTLYVAIDEDLKDKAALYFYLQTSHRREFPLPNFG